MAMRAASIWRAVSHPGSRAWMPKSPKVTAVPPLAAPVMRPRCCLRCLTLRGMSTSVHLPSEVRRLVVLAAPALDLLLLGQLALELIGHRQRRDEVRRRHACHLLLGHLGDRGRLGGPGRGLGGWNRGSGLLLEAARLGLVEPPPPAARRDQAPR